MTAKNTAYKDTKLQTDIGYAAGRIRDTAGALKATIDLYHEDLVRFACGLPIVKGTIEELHVAVKRLYGEIGFNYSQFNKLVEEFKKGNENDFA